MMRSGAFFLLLAITALSLAAVTTVQADSIRRRMIQKEPIETPATREVTVERVIPAGAETPLHTHPGVELAYVFQGSGALLIEGKPESKLSRYDNFTVQRDTVHSIRNIGSGPLVISSTYIVDYGQPAVMPVR